MHFPQITLVASCHCPSCIWVSYACVLRQIYSQPQPFIENSLPLSRAQPAQHNQVCNERFRHPKLKMVQQRPKTNPGEGAALPRPTFFNSALVVGLFVVELVVAGVSAPGSGCDHGTGLPRGVVTWAFRRGGQGEKETKSGHYRHRRQLGKTSTPQHLPQVVCSSRSSRITFRQSFSQGQTCPSSWPAMG